MIDRRFWIEGVFTQAHPSSGCGTKRDIYAAYKSNYNYHTIIPVPLDWLSHTSPYSHQWEGPQNWGIYVIHTPTLTSQFKLSHQQGWRPKLFNFKPQEILYQRNGTSSRQIFCSQWGRYVHERSEDPRVQRCPSELMSQCRLPNVYRHLSSKSTYLKNCIFWTELAKF